MQLILGDCLDELKALADNSVDSIVTDPPYGISFMNRKWDYDIPSIDIWIECLRVLKPGGHILAFASSRTYHRMAIRIEDAGFIIRDQLMWIYGSGFPKNHKIGDGWGTALKPAHEPIVMARKPLSEKTVAGNVLKWGTGAINIDDTRIKMKDGDKMDIRRYNQYQDTFNSYIDGNPNEEKKYEVVEPNSLGRWPANIMFDDDTDENWKRYFYCPKASNKDKNEGLDQFEEKLKAGAEFRPNHMEKALEGQTGNPFGRWNKIKNNHPTVKPTELMVYLIKLVTPPQGIVLDPFMGSGSTGKAAIKNGFDFIGVEKEEEYLKIAKERIKI